MTTLMYTRRRLLTTGAVVLGAAALPLRMLGTESKRIFRSQDGFLDADLEAKIDWIPLAGRSAHLFAYNGQVPGPLLEVRPGDTVRLRFTNHLQSPTNLHFHGLHVPPTGNADNAFVEVQSGERFDYEFTLPRNHPAGAFWYHPHVHGSAADQVSKGLAGLIVVRGELDEIPEVAAAVERFLVLQDFALDSKGEVTQPAMMERMNGREGSLITVDGEVNPTLPILSGGLLRLRLLNASPSRFYRLKLEEHPLHLIATDGGALPAPVSRDEILIAPGERADILVSGNLAGGVYRLLNMPYNRGAMGMMGGPVRVSRPETLATIVYEGRAATQVRLPGGLIAVDPLPVPDTPTRQFVLSEAGIPGRGMSFLINGKLFDHHRVDTKVRLGSVEDWEIVNLSGMDHPFHLHTNSFQVLDADGQPERAWKDVILVPRRQRRRFRVRFDDFTGKAFYHCHILDHEDLGMMGIVEVGNSGEDKHDQ